MLEVKKFTNIDALHNHIVSLLSGGEQQMDELMDMIDPDKVGNKEKMSELRELLSVFNDTVKKEKWIKRSKDE